MEFLTGQLMSLGTGGFIVDGKVNVQHSTLEWLLRLTETQSVSILYETNVMRLTLKALQNKKIQFRHYCLGTIIIIIMIYN